MPTNTARRTTKQTAKPQAPKKLPKVNTPVRPPNGHRTNGHQALSKPVKARAGNQTIAPQWLVTFIPVERIQPSPYQPRLSFDPEEMADLVASVRAKGVQQPIMVRTCKAAQETVQAGENTDIGKANSNGNGNGALKPKPVPYELIAGERRLRACKEAGRKLIPAIIRDDLSDAEAAELALLENVQRSNLSVIEEARGYKRLMLQFRMKEERIAKKVGKSVGTIKETMELLQLPEAVQKLLAEKKLTASHGQALLPLSPFERVCVLVANKAVKDHLTATSLQSTPLPNVPELKRLGLLAELDWRTKFDWRNICGSCPFKAYVTSSYGAYCLKPDEWNKKQEAAIEQQKQEANRVMEEARQQNGQAVEAEKLSPGSYRNLSLASVPAGCSESCHCRSQAADPHDPHDPHDPTKKYPICLDPSRLNELLKTEREAKEEARRQTYQALWHRAKEKLQAEIAEQNLSRVTTLLALPVLQAAFCRYMDPEQWQALARTVAVNAGVFVPWDDLLDEETADGELYELLMGQLEAQKPEKLLLLCACLLLAYEANQVVRFGGETPGIDFVLSRKPEQQRELEEQEESSGEIEEIPSTMQNTTEEH
jgi:ParB/RepB/Spo0J family partition protein